MRSYNPSVGSAAAGRVREGQAATPGRANGGVRSVEPLTRALERLVRETEWRNLSPLQKILEEFDNPWKMPVGRKAVERGLAQLLRRLFPMMRALDLARIAADWFVRRQALIQRIDIGADPDADPGGQPGGGPYDVPPGYFKINDFSGHHIPHTGHDHHAEFALAWTAEHHGQPTDATLNYPPRTTFPVGYGNATNWRSTRRKSDQMLFNVIVNWEEWKLAPGPQPNWRWIPGLVRQLGQQEKVDPDIIPSLMPAVNPIVGGVINNKPLPARVIEHFNHLARTNPILGRERGPARVRAERTLRALALPDLVIERKLDTWPRLMREDPPSHRYKPAGPGMTEIKLRSTTKTFWWRLLGKFTETDDFVRSLHKSLPKECQRARDWKDKSGKFHRKLMSSMLRDIKACAGHMNIVEAFKNVAIDQLQDLAIGKSQQALNKASRALFGTTGVQGAGTRLGKAQEGSEAHWGKVFSELGELLPPVKGATYAAMAGGGKAPDLRHRRPRTESRRDPTWNRK